MHVFLKDFIMAAVMNNKRFFILLFPHCLICLTCLPAKIHSLMNIRKPLLCSDTLRDPPEWEEEEEGDEEGLVTRRRRGSSFDVGKV